MRPAAGQRHSADGWRAALESVVACYLGGRDARLLRQCRLRHPEMYELLQTARVGYTVRLPANISASLKIKSHLFSGIGNHRSRLVPAKRG